MPRRSLNIKSINRESSNVQRSYRMGSHGKRWIDTPVCYIDRASSHQPMNPYLQMWKYDTEHPCEQQMWMYRATIDLEVQGMG